MITSYNSPIRTKHQTVSDSYDSYSMPNGAIIECRRYGNVVNISCGTGALSRAFTAHSDVVTLPSEYWPSSLISTPDYGTNGTRVRITNGGAVQTWAAKARGDNLIFSACYVVDD